MPALKNCDIAVATAAPAMPKPRYLTKRMSRTMFVTEAIMLCLIGGIIGIILGVLGGMAIGWIAKILVSQFYAEYAEVISITIQPSLPAILIAVAFSVLTGIFFGYYPANKAAKMNPIDALRYD